LKFRRSSFALALFLLAFVGRLTGAYALAPVVFDPISNAPICAQVGDASAPNGAPSTEAHAKCLSDCCKIFATATPHLAPKPSIRVETRIEWQPRPTAALVDRHAFVHRARGPPAFS
jgi:hypothetical protein